MDLIIVMCIISLCLIKYFVIIVCLIVDNFDVRCVINNLYGFYFIKFIYDFLILWWINM